LDFRRLLQLESVRGEIWVNRRSVKTAYPLHTPTQDRIKCSVWVWSRELLSIIFRWRTLGASDPPNCRGKGYCTQVEDPWCFRPPAVEVRVRLG
ncbi:hypothetical protein PanWU01x14_371440, partial [Parasponia andersonii]